MTIIEAYNILGLKANPIPNLAAINKAYREAALTLHPDKSQKLSLVQQVRNNELLNRLNLAKSYLCETHHPADNPSDDKDLKATVGVFGNEKAIASIISFEIKLSKYFTKYLENPQTLPSALEGKIIYNPTNGLFVAQHPIDLGSIADAERNNVLTWLLVMMRAERLDKVRIINIPSKLNVTQKFLLNSINDDYINLQALQKFAKKINVLNALINRFNPILGIIALFAMLASLVLNPWLLPIYLTSLVFPSIMVNIINRILKNSSNVNLLHFFQGLQNLLLVILGISLLAGASVIFGPSLSVILLGTFTLLNYIVPACNLVVHFFITSIVNLIIVRIPASKLINIISIANTDIDQEIENLSHSQPTAQLSSLTQTAVSRPTTVQSLEVIGYRHYKNLIIGVEQSAMPSNAKPDCLLAHQPLMIEAPTTASGPAV